MINGTQNTDAAALFASLNGTASPASSANSAASTQDRFLKLLVTQMKNQDPLNPMDNAQVTSQMAQLSTVTGIDKLNVTLQALSDSMTTNQSFQVASMLGHGVLVPGTGVDLSGVGGFGGVALSQSVDNVNIAIYDKSGSLVRNVSLGAQAAGLAHWQWDGRDNAGNNVAAGTYTFTADAAQAGVKVDVTTLQFGVVNSITQGKQGVTLGVGQLEGIAMSQVKQII